jgi:hypothetical protein
MEIVSFVLFLSVPFAVTVHDLNPRGSATCTSAGVRTENGFTIVRPPAAPLLQ